MGPGVSAGRYGRHTQRPFILFSVSLGNEVIACVDSSPVKILKKQEQIATECFLVEYGRLGHPQYRIKNPPKSDHGKIAK
jgi:hypothetical protein